MNEEQRNVMGSGRGFIAALDQSGGSTPKALKLYGMPEDAYDSDEKMFDLIHQMRERLISSPSFFGDKVLATILFEQTMDRTINGEDSTAYLWKQKHIVPFVKVDKGLDSAENGVQLMKPMTKLDSLLERAVDRASSVPRCARSFKSRTTKGSNSSTTGTQSPSADLCRFSSQRSASNAPTRPKRTACWSQR